ncbi:MAG: ferritin-like fold-containing protein [Actinomycetota bacterium]
MVSLFSRRPRRTDVPRPKPRRESAAQVDRVDLAELTPELLPYLGQAAYVQLALFETLSRAVSVAPSAASKVAVSRVAALALAKHHGLAAEIKRLGHEPGLAMAPFAARIDEYARTTLGADWYEMLVTAYLTAGLLGDFQLQLAAGLPGEARLRIIPLLSGDDGHALLVDELRSAIDANPRLASRLALWGRRLVGDTLLIARSSLANVGHTRRDEARLEPVFTDLIASHTRRMDALGLTA